MPRSEPRRERLIRIIDYYKSHHDVEQYMRFVRRYGWHEILTDDAIEDYADLVTHHDRLRRKLNSQNRAALEARKTEAA